MIADAGPEHVRLELAQLRRLEAASLVEATTLVLLVGVAVPFKHLAGMPLAVTVMGPIHGLAFAAYVWTVLQTVAGGGWRRAEWLPLIRRRAESLALAQAGTR